MFSFTRAGKRRCRYVPAEFAPVLKRALADGRRLELRLTELGAERLEMGVSPLFVFLLCFLCVLCVLCG